MVALIRKRNADGTFGTLEKIGEGLTDKERVKLLEEENLNLKLAIVELVDVNSQLNTETQMAMAELAELILGGVE